MMHMYRSEAQFDGLTDDMLDTAVAIVGMSCRFAGVRTPEEYWANLRAGVESVRTFSDEELQAAGVSARQLADPAYVRAGAPLDDMEWFDAALFGMSPRDAAIMDPQHRHFLECAWEALENAGHDPRRFAGAIGVFAGSGHNAYLGRNLLSNPSLVRNVGPFLLRHTGNDKDFLTTRASYLLNLRGPSINVQTACSTSLVAVHMAVQHLLGDECDMAIAGGVSIELPHGQGYAFEEGGILSPDGHCRPFDVASQGTVFGSGVGLVVLRRLRDAIADGDHIHAVIRGTAVNNDGSGKVGYLAPSIDGQAAVIAEALDVADVPARTIGYVEAHGTGTPVGDPIEVAALTQAFRRDTDDVGFCALGSVKANIGHTDTAAGTAGLIKIAMALQHRELPPTINYSADNPACALEDSPFRVNGALRPWAQLEEAPRRAGISSLGVGGTNAHAVIEEAPRRSPSGPSRSHHLLTFSAATPRALDSNAAALAAALSSDRAISRADAAYTLSIGRQALAKRAIMVVDDEQDVADALSRPDRLISADALPDRRVAFMFCGAGSQYAGMGAKLYASEPVFRAAVDDCLRASEIDFGRWLFPSAEDADQAAREMERPSIALPALFTVQVALARLWQSWGISPSGMIGHSSGEYAAAHIAGVIDLADALRIVGMRGRLFETLPEGGMLSVPMAEDELRALLPADLSIAAINGASLCVASGNVAAIARLEQDLTARGIETRRVNIAVAAHSPMLDPLLAEFRQCLASVKLGAPALPFVSNLTGTWITAADTQDPEYWVRHLRQTVRFTDGLQQLLTEPTDVLLEVGPGRTMASLARQHPGRDRSQPVLTSMRHPDEDVDDTLHLLTCAGRLWALGVPLDWAGYWAGEQRHRIPLPTYAFDRERHWIEPGVSTTIEEHDANEPLRREADVADWFYEPVWHRAPALPPAVADGDALVFVDERGLGDAIAARLRAAGRRVCLVHRGRRFAARGDGFAIDPASPADYLRLAQALVSQDRWPTQIYHCWLVTGPSHRDDARATAALLDRGFYSVMALAKAAGECMPGTPLRIALISDGMQRVAGEVAMSPAKAAALGAIRVLASEYPDIDARSIDIATEGNGDAASADLILAELANDATDVVSYRAGERWVQSFDRAPRPSADDTLISDGGVYLITGGLGGLGLTIARNLSEKSGARIVLLARNPLPPRSRWDQLLADSDLDDAMSDRIRAVRAIEAAGGQVLVVTADVTDRRAVAAAVRQVRATFGRINGVFHAAGVLDDELAQLKTPAAARAVLAPKVFGTLALDAALWSTPPDFLILFSSISAFAGLPGQVDYAAANAFLDAFAQARRGGATRVISVGWSKWQEVGMAAQPRAVAPARETRPIDHPFLQRLITFADGTATVAGRFSADRDWLLDEHRLADGRALIPGTGYLELVRVGFAATGPAAAPIALRDVNFLAPFAVADGASRDMRIRFQPEDGGTRFTVAGRPTDQAQGGWTDHVSGSVEPIDLLRPTPLELAAIRLRCGETPAAGSGPETSPFLRFGPRWHNVTDAAFGQGEALLELSLPTPFHDDLDRIALHPALLDFATAGAQALVPGEGRFLAPLSYGSITLWAPLPARIVSHIRYRAGGSASRDLAVFDVTITDELGSILVDIRDFTMIAVRDPSLLAGGSSAPVQGAADENGLTPGDGLAALDRILAAPHRPHLIVSPQPLAAAIARLHPAPRAPVERASGNDNGAAAPRTAGEIAIAQLWGEMLGVSDVRRDDDFFDLGGHSLLAVQFVNRLRKKTGKAVPLSALLERPTVERLAVLIDPEGAASAVNGVPPNVVADAAIDAPSLPPGVVTLRPGGRGPALFIVHDGLGETMLYRGLAMALAGDRAVYGLDPERREDGSYRHTAIREMAAAYVDRIRQVQPDGPYLLAGLCAGGVIAFEMAQQLQGAGATVAFVGVMDAADVDAAPRRFYVMQNRWSNLRRALTSPSGTAGPGPMALLLMKSVNAVRWEIGSRIERARRTRAVADMAGGVAPRAELTFLQLYEVAHREHRPQGLFTGGDVTLFRSTSGTGAEDDIPFAEKYSDCILGWGQRVDDDVTLVEVPGGHTSLLQPPHVDTLARLMQARIDAALAKYPPSLAPDATPPVPVSPAPALVTP